MFLDFELKDIVIVDNAVYSFLNQLENGIPIIPFRYDKEDNQLDHLIQYLPYLSSLSDVRESLRRVFKLEELFKLSENLKIYVDDED